MKMQYVLSVSQLARSTLFSMVGMRVVNIEKSQFSQAVSK